MPILVSQKQLFNAWHLKYIASNSIEIILNLGATPGETRGRGGGYHAVPVTEPGTPSCKALLKPFEASPQLSGEF